jgi:hypothetical protein
MALPITKPIVYPPGLDLNRNGQLFPSELTPIFLPGVGMGTMHPTAVRAFNCLFLMALVDTGQTMTATSNGDDYRSYDMQLRVFEQRYSPTYDPAYNVLENRRKGPDGKMWYLKRSRKNGPPYSPVASPGTSNHGYGIALDCALWLPDVSSKPQSVTSNKLFFAWLSGKNGAPANYRIGQGTNAESFGLSWEMQSEPWHLRLVTGAPTQRVLDIEAFLGVAA